MSLDTYTSPVITGHRGFKANYPENTFLGFKKCYETGATVLETDLWLSKDNVIVISHDINTKRVFVDADGNPTDYNILQTNYHDTLKNLKTIGSNENLLTFREVLGWFAHYSNEHNSNIHKLQLDIKKFNPPKVAKHIIKDMLAVKNDITWWYHRIQFGVWDLNLIKYINQDEFFRQYFDGTPNKFGYKQFDLFHISLSWKDSIHYINYNFYLDALKDIKKDDTYKVRVTGISLIYVSTWSTGFITKFVPLLRIQNLKFYSWTINNNLQFDYLVKLGKNANLVEYGIITDHPDLMVIRKGELENESEDDKLVSELTKLSTYSTCSEAYTEEGELRIDLTLKQKLIYFVFNSVQVLSGTKRVSSDEKQFDSFVDENKISTIKVNATIQWIFQTCQHYGLF